MTKQLILLQGSFTTGTMICGNNSINFTTLSYQMTSNGTSTVHACLQNDGDLDMGRLDIITIRIIFTVQNTFCTDTMPQLKLWTMLACQMWFVPM